MNKTKTINLQGGVKRTAFLLAWAITALFVLSFVGIQSAYAAINTQLDFGDRGSEVSELQTYLSGDANVYPSGLVTGWFGPLTKAGVERFQTANGIVSSGTPETTGYGRVGPRTQAAINAKLAGGGHSTGDVYAPTIERVSVNTNNSSDSAVISWTASEPSMGKVYYSTSPIRMHNTFDSTARFSGEPIVTTGTLAQYDGVARSTHTVNINNLMPNTTYYYLVVAFDSSKNSSITLPASFRTQ